MNRKLLAILLTLSAVALTACGTDPGTNNTEGNAKANCGNGKIDANEACDGANLNGKTSCSAVDPTYTSGTLKCSIQCQFDISECKKTTENPAPTTCGNGKIDTGEECDGSVPADKTCATVTNNAKPNGNLKCTACKIDITECKPGSTPPPQPEKKCEAFQNFFGKGLDETKVEFGAFTIDGGLKPLAEKLFTISDTTETDIEFEVTKAIITAISHKGEYFYAQDKDSAVLVWVPESGSIKYKIGDEVSFKATKGIFHGKRQPRVTAYTDFKVLSSDNKIMAIDGTAVTLDKTTDLNKFVTYQGKIANDGVPSGPFKTWDLNAYNDASKSIAYTMFASAKSAPNKGQCVGFAGPLGSYDGKVQLTVYNYDWGKTFSF